jgi:hypothetical protein
LGGRGTLVAVADGASGLARPEPPVPVEQLIFRGVSAGVKLGGDGVILWEPRPGGRECAFVYDTTVVARVPAGAGREDLTVVGVIERESGCQPVDRGWPEYALTDLDDRPVCHGRWPVRHAGAAATPVAAARRPALLAAGRGARPADHRTKPPQPLSSRLS